MPPRLCYKSNVYSRRTIVFLINDILWCVTRESQLGKVHTCYSSQLLIGIRLCSWFPWGDDVTFVGTVPMFYGLASSLIAEVSFTNDVIIRLNLMTSDYRGGKGLTVSWRWRHSQAYHFYEIYYFFTDLQIDLKKIDIWKFKNTEIASQYQFEVFYYNCYSQDNNHMILIIVNYRINLDYVCQGGKKNTGCFHN